MDQNTEANVETAAEVEPTTAADELSLLKERAKLLGISHSPNIGLKALREKIAAALEGGDGDKDADTDTAESADPASLSPLAQKAALRRKLYAEEMKLIRVRITNMNPSKKDLHGEIFTVANKYLGIVKKFVPYGEATDNGYHIPYVIYKQLKSRKFLQIKTRKDPRNPGQILVDQRWVPEFAIEVMEPLTQAELEKLKQQQMAVAGIS